MHHQLDKTICAIATAPGMGAIAVIRLSGKEALTIADRIFFGAHPLSEAEGYSAHFGKIKYEERIIDEVIATVFRAPKSFTGENSVEFSCHGAVYIQQEIIKCCLDHGAQMAQPGEFTLRAFMNRKMDLSQAEAVADLISADSKAAHKLAMQQLRGGFSDEIKQLRERLIHFASMIELELDFGEEDVAFADRTELKTLALKIHKKISTLIESFSTGNAFKKGIPVAIAGKPNAGKSTLLNALLNEERAIVSDIAGTTRDTIEETIHIDGVSYRLIDTAGIRESTDTIEVMGVKKTMEQVSRADLLLYIFDAAESSFEQAVQDVAAINKKDIPVLFAANKTDLIDKEKKNQLIAKSKDKAFHLIPISAGKKQEIETLKEKISQIMLTKLNTGFDVTVSNSRHYEALKQANVFINNVIEGIETEISSDLLALDIRSSLHYLGLITGQVTTDDLLDNIFSKFCIGK